MHKSWLIPVAACALLVSLTVVSGSAQHGREAPTRRGWPPDPTRIVNLDGQEKVSKGRSFTVFEVPADKAFVVTDYSVIATSGTMWKAPHLIERRGKKAVVKRSSEHSFFYHGETYQPLRYSSAVGIVFAPGSRVELRAESGGVGWHYHFTGYLADAR